MKKRSNTLAAITSLIAGVTLPAHSTAQGTGELLPFLEQCEALANIQDDRTALRRELDLLLSNSPDSLLCEPGASDEERQNCIDQCVGALAALLDISPIAQIPDPNQY